MFADQWSENTVTGRNSQEQEKKKSVSTEFLLQQPKTTKIAGIYQT